MLVVWRHLVCLIVVPLVHRTNYEVAHERWLWCWTSVFFSFIWSPFLSPFCGRDYKQRFICCLTESNYFSPVPHIVSVVLCRVTIQASEIDICVVLWNFSSERTFVIWNFCHVEPPGISCSHPPYSITSRSFCRSPNTRSHVNGLHAHILGIGLSSRPLTCFTSVPAFNSKYVVFTERDIPSPVPDTIFCIKIRS